MKVSTNGSQINSFGSYCMPLVEIKGFNALVNKKPYLSNRKKKKTSGV